MYKIAKTQYYYRQLCVQVWYVQIWNEKYVCVVNK